MVTPTSITELDPADPSFVANPHPTYARLRANSPVQLVALPNGTRFWIITGHDEARLAMSDHRLGKDPGLAAEHLRSGPNPLLSEKRPFGNHLLTSDPPDHSRLRKLVNKTFTVRRISALSPRIREISDGLLDDLTGRAQFDLVEDYASLLPTSVICELLGVPYDDRGQFRTWSTAVVSPNGGSAEQRDTAGYELRTYLSELIRLKAVTPADDLLSELVAVSEDGDRLSSAELLSMAFLLLVVGHETTVNLIGNAALALMRNPEQLARLAADPGLVDGAIDELIRYDGPIETSTWRLAITDLRIGAAEIRQGDAVLVALAAANRDPEHFPAPDLLNITRDASRHLGFGHGIHYCLGAQLARAEARTAFRRLSPMLRDHELAVPEEQLEWRPGLLARGLFRLPLRRITA
ncbi:Cytochrome P450 [Lentzea xinjiangensis]|uniref:Cytochrome P450 n=1 Tax=Lentzea xinjiangensis TaxID=402600 RepID=A0A1H9SY66_9PSEU|nr:cytochrome P450 [Lentzea xinjiangensis]SER89777.1 Cytochrome P450 [Lentzea xinjiangensis]